MLSPAELIQMIRNGQNPQQLTLRILQERMGNTPMGLNLLQLAKEGKTPEIEQIVRNIFEQQGINFDQEFATFKNKLGL